MTTVFPKTKADMMARLRESRARDAERKGLVPLRIDTVYVTPEQREQVLALLRSWR